MNGLAERAVYAMMPNTYMIISAWYFFGGMF